MNDVLFSVDVEADGAIPGPFSMLSFAFVEIGRSDGRTLELAEEPRTFYRELAPISESFDPETLRISGLDRDRLLREGTPPLEAMDDARAFVREVAEGGKPVLVAFPLGYDWMWLYWYFMRFGNDSPFSHSRGFDMKTAYAVQYARPLTRAGRERLPAELRSERPHMHHALHDALEQADIFVKLFEARGMHGG